MVVLLQNEIEALVPHREPMLFINQAEIYLPEEKADEVQGDGVQADVAVNPNPDTAVNLNPDAAVNSNPDTNTSAFPIIATGRYTVRGDEFFLKGHYPGNPIVPGNIQCEMLAQLGAVIIQYDMTLEEYPYSRFRSAKTLVLVGTDNVRFKKVVKPGDTLEMKLEIIRDTAFVINAKAVGYVENQLAVSMEMTVAYI